MFSTVIEGHQKMNFGSSSFKKSFSDHKITYKKSKFNLFTHV